MLNINDQKHTGNRRKITQMEIGLSLAFLIVFFAPLAQASSITSSKVIELVNAARKANQLKNLTRNAVLDQAAEDKAQDMIVNDYFAHISPTGKSPWNWIEESGYDYRYAGENLAINFTKAEDQQKAWMESELHRKNILNPDYNDIGVAVKEGKIDGQNTIITVQMFGSLMTKENAAAQKNNYAAGGVAGASDQNKNITNGAQAKEETKKFSLQEIYQKNPTDFMVWFSVFALTLVIAVADIVVAIYRKEKTVLALRGMHR